MEPTKVIFSIFSWSPIFSAQASDPLIPPVWLGRKTIKTKARPFHSYVCTSYSSATFDHGEKYRRQSSSTSFFCLFSLIGAASLHFHATHTSCHSVALLPVTTRAVTCIAYHIDVLVGVRVAKPAHDPRPATKPCM